MGLHFHCFQLVRAEPPPAAKQVRIEEELAFLPGSSIYAGIEKVAAGDKGVPVRRGLGAGMAMFYEHRLAMGFAGGAVDPQPGRCPNCQQRGRQAAARSSLGVIPLTRLPCTPSSCRHGWAGVLP